MDLDVLTGLRPGQRLALYGRCRQLIGTVVKPGGRPPVIDLYRSIMMVVCLMRKNGLQEFTGAIFGVSQSTVNRRWDLLRPVIRRAVASFIPRPREVLGCGTALVDGTITPTWNWKHVPDLFSAKAGYAGMNVQVAANLRGDIAAVGPLAVHGARHDAHAFEASGLKPLLAGIPAAGDLGYVGVEGIDIVPIKRASGCDLRVCDEEFNTAFNRIRAAIERAVATLKTWRMLSQEGGRYERPSKNSRKLNKPSPDYTSFELLHRPPGCTIRLLRSATRSPFGWRNATHRDPPSLPCQQGEFIHGEAIVKYIEVEQKFALTEPDRLKQQLEELGGKPGPAVRQMDTYYNALHHDFLALKRLTR